MTPSKKPEKAPDILSSALLANVKISTWQARKHDREVTAKTNEAHKANASAGRYHKHLFAGGVVELSELNTAASYLRWTHYAQTLPYSDDGWRLLPTANYMEYCRVMRSKIADVETKLEKFLQVYEKACRGAEEKLGDMWKKDDYPSIDAIRDKYRFELEFSPIPAGENLRVNLPKAELERVERQVTQRLTEAANAAMAAAWARLGDEIVELRSKLGKGLRDAAIEKVRAMAEMLERLNLTDDEQLEAARVRVMKELGTLDAKTLREDDAKMKQASAAADAILKSMKGMYTPAAK